MKKNCILFIAVLAVQVSWAQNSIRPNIYLQDMQYYNPAATITDTSLHAQTAIYGKYKSVENEETIWNKPMNIWLSHAGRIGSSNSFYTVSYVNDRYSYFSRNSLYVGYARQVKIGRSSVFSFGGRVVANADRVNWRKFQLPHSQSGSSFYFNPDLDLGVTYQFKGFSAGAGFKNLLGTVTRIDEAVLLQNKREINVNLSYRQSLIRNRLALTPFVLLARERSTLIDAGLCFTIADRVRASYALRVNELKSVIVLDADITKNWSVGAAYDRSSLVSDHNFDLVLRYRR